MPRARVVPFSGDIPTSLAEPAALLLLTAPTQLPPETSVILHFDSLEAYGAQLFRAFREADDKGCAVICAELPPSEGLGRALRDRILRAAGLDSA
jgi:L-threonylcarbamoyladenylate synthase